MTDFSQENWDNFLSFTQELGVALNQNQVTKLQTYYQLLVEWNKRINLISRKDLHRIIGYHFVDSLVCLRFIPAEGSVCDLGAGAGLPGIPVKIVREQVELYLVEAIKKKCNFLAEAIKTLNLKNAHVLNQRAEAITSVKVDVVLARLLGPVQQILPWGMPLLKAGGRFLIYKSASAEAEVAEAKTTLRRFKGHVETIQPIVLPGSGIIRRLVSLIKS